MLEVHQAIDASARELATGLGDGDAEVALLPPGGRLSPAEREQVAALAAQAAAAEPALRKLVADACASAFFRVFNVLDATGDPGHYDGDWLPIELTMSDDGAAPQPMLHDEFTDTWWDWQRLGDAEDR
jgi:hypothetical protein